MNFQRINRPFLPLAALIVLLILTATARGADQRPNILFLMTDDQRNDTLGCAGHPIVKKRGRARRPAKKPAK